MLLQQNQSESTESSESESTESASTESESTEDIVSVEGEWTAELDDEFVDALINGLWP